MAGILMPLRRLKRGLAFPLLLLLALGGVAVIAWPRENGKVVDDIGQLGGSVTVNGSLWRRAIFAVDLHGAALDDDWLARLQGFAELRELDLAGTPVTSAGLRHIAALRTLRGLNLCGTRVDDAGLAELTGLVQLQELGLGGCPVSDAGLRHLAALPRLERVNLHGTRVTEDGIRRLEAARTGINVQH
jgi:hypothetical protein